MYHKHSDQYGAAKHKQSFGCPCQSHLSPQEGQ